jgi:DNA-binding NarL/FixJ family response regulator
MKILVVDDHPVYLSGMIALLKQLKKGHIIEDASNGQIAYDLMLGDNFDLIFLDLDMPIMNGFELLKKINEAPPLPKPKVIVMSVNEDEASIAACYKLHADGFIPKSTSREELIRLFDNLSNNDHYYPKKLFNKLLNNIYLGSQNKKLREIKPDNQLSTLECQFLVLTAFEYPNKHIADRLGTTESTIKSMKYKLYKKIKCKNMVGATLYGLKNQFFTLRDLNDDKQIEFLLEKFKAI